MIKKLLVVFISAALISMVCFTLLGVMGGFPSNLNGPPWGNGDWGWRGGRHGEWNPGGPVASRNLTYSGGYQLDINYPAEITVTQGAQPRFTVTGPQGLIDQLTLEDGALSGPHGPRWNWGWNHAPREDRRLRIDIVTPDTHEFHLNGTQKLTLHGYDQDSLALYISGAADVGGDGKAKRLNAYISGAGHLDLEQLAVDDAHVSISGAGDASLNARNSADVSISGAGHVEFKCRPEGGLSQHISGFGSVDEGPNCSASPPPAASSTPAPAEPQAAAPKSKV
jgi:hypothetical protein